MALNDPTPIAHQNMMMYMEKMSKDKKKPVEDKGGLLGPKKSMQKPDSKFSLDDPRLRVASYMELIQTKRKELKNG